MVQFTAVESALFMQLAAGSRTVVDCNVHLTRLAIAIWADAKCCMLVQMLAKCKMQNAKCCMLVQMLAKCCMLVQMKSACLISLISWQAAAGQLLSRHRACNWQQAAGQLLIVLCMQWSWYVQPECSPVTASFVNAVLHVQVIMALIMCGVNKLSHSAASQVEDVG
jgi:hypothetical protein